jgi:hypothetical protein
LQAIFDWLLISGAQMGGVQIGHAAPKTIHNDVIAAEWLRRIYIPGAQMGRVSVGQVEYRVVS